LKLFSRLSYRNKLLIFMMSMVIFVAGTMGFLIRFIILPHLIREMESHAESAAARLSQNTRSFILNRDTTHLTAALFDEKHLEKSIAHIIVTDDEHRLLSHTFVGDVPESSVEDRGGGHASSGTRFTSAALLAKGGISDIVVPVHEGLYQIGTIRVGVDNRYIDSAIREMNLFHLGFTGFITGVSLLFGFYLSGVITRPITFLTKLAGEISFGKLNTCIFVGPRMGQWDIEPCHGTDRPAPGIKEARLPCSDDVSCTTPSIQSDGPSPGPGPSDGRVNDEIVLLADAFNNMTRRLRSSEGELRLSEQNYRLLFNSNPNPVFVVARDSYGILDANDRASEIYGHPKETLLNMKFSDLGFQEDASLSADAFGRLDGSTQPRALFPRIRHRGQGGETFWVNVFFSYYEHMGKPAVIATTMDISDIIDTETKLIQASKMATLGEMSAGVAHELNQPLNAIKVGSEFLLTISEQGRTLHQDQLQEVASAVSKEVDRASSIINHLREFGRKTIIFKQRVDINKPIHGVFTIMGQQLKVHGIDVTTELDETLPPILADENRIEQVLINLVNNARDAMETKRESGNSAGPNLLSVRSFLENDRVVVAVSDTGVGIPLNKQGRIFEPFFTTKPVGKGTGLGLSISYGIVRDYDGSIEYETEEGVGTTFKVSFPIARGEEGYA
jgi:PAS domain S-box-containing protein